MLNPYYPRYFTIFPLFSHDYPIIMKHHGITNHVKSQFPHIFHVFSHYYPIVIGYSPI